MSSERTILARDLRAGDVILGDWFQPTRFGAGVLVIGVMHFNGEVLVRNRIEDVTYGEMTSVRVGDTSGTRLVEKADLKPGDVITSVETPRGPFHRVETVTAEHFHVHVCPIEQCTCGPGQKVRTHTSPRTTYPVRLREK
jgi:hypothetical protein